MYHLLSPIPVHFFFYFALPVFPSKCIRRCWCRHAAAAAAVASMDDVHWKKDSIVFFAVDCRQERTVKAKCGETATRHVNIGWPLCSTMKWAALCCVQIWGEIWVAIGANTKAYQILIHTTAQYIYIRINGIACHMKWLRYGRLTDRWQSACITEVRVEVTIQSLAILQWMMFGKCLRHHSQMMSDWVECLIITRKGNFNFSHSVQWSSYVILAWWNASKKMAWHEKECGSPSNQYDTTRHTLSVTEATNNNKRLYQQRVRHPSRMDERADTVRKKQ